MSAKYTFAVYETRVGSATEKLVLLKLADNANDEGLCWPGMGYLSKHTELGLSTIKRSIKSLEEKGLLKVARRKDESGSKNLPNVYRLTLPSVTLTPLSVHSDPTPPSTVTPESKIQSKKESIDSQSKELAHKIIDLWNDIKKANGTNWQAVDVRTKKRISLTNQRIKQVRQRIDEPTDKKVWNWFSDFFCAMAKDPWYSGKQNNYKLEFGQMMAEDYFVKTIERLNGE